MPYAFRQGGLTAASIGLIIIAWVTGYCCNLLVLCKRKVCFVLAHVAAPLPLFNSLLTISACPSLCAPLCVAWRQVELAEPLVQTYGDVAFFVWGRVGRLVTDAALMVTQFGFCVGYIVFLSAYLPPP